MVVLALVGPTASGKSQLAIEVAQALGSAEIVSTDSMQAYVGMDIGTATVPLSERRGIPHQQEFDQIGDEDQHRQHVVDQRAAAVAAGKEKLNDSSWATFSRYLYTGDMPEPDLVIRTSGETRMSNFLLLQAAYAEFVFMPVLWPDFTKADLAAAISDYNRRERRFGLTSEQLTPPIKAAAKLRT